MSSQYAGKRADHAVAEARVGQQVMSFSPLVPTADQHHRRNVGSGVQLRQRSARQRLERSGRFIDDDGVTTTSVLVQSDQ